MLKSNITAEIPTTIKVPQTHTSETDERTSQVARICWKWLLQRLRLHNPTVKLSLPRSDKGASVIFHVFVKRLRIDISKNKKMKSIFKACEQLSIPSKWCSIPTWTQKNQLSLLTSIRSQSVKDPNCQKPEYHRGAMRSPLMRAHFTGTAAAMKAFLLPTWKSIGHVTAESQAFAG